MSHLGHVDRGTQFLAVQTLENLVRAHRQAVDDGVDATFSVELGAAVDRVRRHPEQLPALLLVAAQLIDSAASVVADAQPLVSPGLALSTLFDVERQRAALD